MKYWMVIVSAMFLAVSFPATAQQAVAGTGGLDPKGLAVAHLLLAEDVTGALLGHDAITSQADALRLVSIDLSVAAKDYASAYDENEIAADRQFSGKKIVMLGTILGINKDALGNPYLSLAGPRPYVDVIARLNRQGEERAARLKKGAKVLLVCKASGKVLRSAVAKNCEFLSQHMDDIKSDLDKKISGFIGGVSALPKNVAEVVVFFYLFGASLPQDSKCLSDIQGCGKSIEKFAADRETKKSAADLMGRLKIQ